MSDDYYEFDCGCRVPIDHSLPPVHGKPSLIYRVEDVPLDCPATWEMISSGRTKGIFQLEGNLGKKWSKRLKPENIEQLSALLSLLRPGCLRAVDDRGVSMTELYCRRKNGEEPVDIDIDAVKDILEPTFDVIVFQESFMQIAQVVAGFDLVEVDRLRKASAKKDPKAMTEVGELFVEKASNLGVITKEQAESLFGNIKKSARYSFNKCCSYDTKIMRSVRVRWSGSWAPLTVDEMYRIRNDMDYAKRTNHGPLRHKWIQRGNYGKGLSLCEDGRIRGNIIADIQPSGSRMVYKITLANGATIRVTGNHRFPTSDGEMTVEEMLSTGGWGPRFRDVMLFVKGGCEKIDPVKRRGGIRTLTDRKTAPGTGRSGESWYDSIYLCGSCRKELGYALGAARRNERRYLSESVPIASIDEDGECMTYDITMDAPHHNFVVESGIVTCNSHAVCYAVDCYWTSHEKAHYPIEFLTSYLYHSRGKPKPLEEIRELVMEAKHFGIEVKPPQFSDLEPNFWNDGVEIRFGLADVKGIGEKAVAKMKESAIVAEAEAGGRLVATWSWFDFLVYFSEHVDSTTMKRMIEVGALRNFKMDRLRLLAEYDAWKRLNDHEREHVAGLRHAFARDVSPGRLKKFVEANPGCLPHPEDVAVNGDGSVTVIVDPPRPADNLIDAIEQLLLRSTGNTLGTKSDPPRPKWAVSDCRRDAVRSILSLLRNPPSPPVDKPYWIAKKEEESLGIPITFTHVDAADKSRVNATCRDVRDGFVDVGVIGVEVNRVHEVLTKNGDDAGKPMAFLTVSDHTGELGDVVVFASVWEKFGNVLAREHTVVAIGGRRDQLRGGFVVDMVWKI